MTAYGFFIVVVFLGMLLFGFSGLAGLRAWQMRQYQHWDIIERAGLWFALEFSLSAVIFGLLPFLLVYLFRYEATAWRIASLILAAFLFVFVGRVYYQAQLYRVRFPIVLISLLVLSVILMTMELINVFWWSSEGWYAGGLTWILILAAVQFIIFVTYDRNPIAQASRIQSVDNLDEGDAYPRHALGRGWLQRDHGSDHSHPAPNRQPNIYRDPVAYAQRERYAHRFPVTRAARNGWSIPDAPAGSHPNTRRR